MVESTAATRSPVSSFMTATSSKENNFDVVHDSSETQPPKYMTQLNKFTDMQSVLIPELIATTE
jgi:hypothetical protein